VSLFPELLQHQSGIADLQPAPAQFALVDPFPGHLETKGIDVKSQRFFHVSDVEKRHGLPNIGLGLLFGAHRVTSLPSEDLQMDSFKGHPKSNGITPAAGLR
jgi:hypothetical protein